VSALRRAWTAAACAALQALALDGCANSVLIFAADDGGASDDDGGAETDAEAGSGADGGRAPDAASGDAGRGRNDAGGGGGAARALAAHMHTCVAHVDGSYCWGRNADGQLGVGPEETPLFTPARLEGVLSYSQLCAAEQHSCGLRADGKIDCWGGNSKGQLGLGSRSARDFPTPVPAGIEFKWLACGGEQTCAVGKDEELYCWGSNFEGQVGQNDPAGSPDLLVPTRVPLEPGSAQVAVGQGHVCALSDAGALHCWGRNTEAQLGLGRAADGQVRRPTALAGSSAYMSIAAGQRHSCAVRRDGRLVCWGEPFDGRLGLGAIGPDLVHEPVQVGSLADWQSVQVNWFHTCGLRAGGVLMCWGRNAEGQLGIGDQSTRDVPALVSGLEGVTAVTVGLFHTCATSPGGTYCWGKNEYGQLGLGLGPSERADEPTRVALPPP
jgi:alpha-tubulin suppressor-like RCC1 family protein